MILRKRDTAALTLALVFAIGHATTLPAAAQPISVAEIDTLVTRAMSTFDVPGVAVGIVKGGDLVFAKGYGVRELGKSDPVDEQTLFGIASNTKAMTAAALAILVDEGKITWDDKVVDHIPQFQLYDPWVTREFTIRDLLTHRSGLGLGAGDLMTWPETDFTREEVIVAMRHLKPVTSFRSAYAYDNNLYIVAGEIIPAVTGMGWEEFVQARILDRIGMNPCVTTRDMLDDSSNIASPHAVIEGELQTVPADRLHTAAAAGGVLCNIESMAKWLGVLLASGKMADADPLLSAEQHAELWSPQTILPVSDDQYDIGRTHFAAYGLGWGLRDFDGYKQVTHGGGLLGMVTWVVMLPELDVGILVFTNQQSGYALRAIGLQIVKAYTGGESRDFVEHMKESKQKREAEAAEVTDAIGEELQAGGGSIPGGAR
jgi:CubicO group peptidase (beta-lactamase class C family)